MSGLCKIVSGPNNGNYATPKYFYMPCTLFQTLRTTWKIVKKHHFWSISLTIPFGVQIYPFWAFLRVENFFGAAGGPLEGLPSSNQY